MTFPLPNLVTSGIIIVILLSKQLLFGKLDLWNSKGASSGAARSFLDLEFDQRSYPRMLSRDIRLRLGRCCATSPTCTTFIPSTYALLRVLSVAPCGLFLRMCLRTINLARDMSMCTILTQYLCICY